MLAEEQEVIDAAEALRESLLHPKHAATLTPLKARLTRLLARRFRRQSKALLKSSRKWLKWLGDKYTEADSDLKKKLKHAVTVNIEADAVIAGASDDDTAAFAGIATAAASGAAEAFSLDSAISIAKERGNEFATDWLSNHGFTQLASDIDLTTRERIANAVAEVYATGGTYEQAVSAIKDSFAEMTETRAATIAQTELADAYNSALLSSAKEAGGMLKVWSPDGECCEEICQPNVDAGPIGLDEDFPSGDDAPPAHPRCDCSISFVADESLSEAYNPDEPRDEKGEWTAGSASDRVERAKASQVRTGQHEQAIADRSEQVLSDAIGVPRTRDNSAFDLRNEDIGIEVKTLVNGKNEKITMSKAALGRKIAEQRADGIKAYTVVVDRRTGGMTGSAHYYVKEGLGSFRLGSMTPTTLGALKAMVRP